MQPKFLVCGCARSGTGYIATLLSALGCRCGHEAVFNPENITAGDELIWPDELPGESSWLAASFIPSLPVELPVLHQVREPIAFIRSMVGIRFFEVPSAYRVFAELICPELTGGTPVERSMLYWITWNRFVAQEGPRGERPYMRYRLEEVDEDLVARMLDFVGFDCDSEKVSATVQVHPRDYKTRDIKDEDDSIRLDTLPRGELLEHLLELADELGYTISPGKPTLIAA